MQTQNGFFQRLLFVSGFVLVGLLVFMGSASQNRIALADEPMQVEAQGDFFVTSPICGSCHTNVVDGAGTDISFDVAWRSSVMANASNDPYWLASVRRETVANPAELTPVIEDVCATCHMPMARFTATVDGEPSLIFGEEGYMNPDHALHDFAAEGVSCTVCHQIQGDNFGETESHDGGYLIDSETRLSDGDRLLYGTFDMKRGARRMLMGSGFDPVLGEHLSASEMCATCHDLTTPYLDENDEIAGTIPEQTPYTEWANSAYKDDKTCVDCHMLRAVGEVLMAKGGEPRSNLAIHHTTGGNNFLLRLLAEHDLGQNIGAQADQFEMAIGINQEFLRNQTATLALENAALVDGELVTDVVITNLAGHKLPTSFPSRRVWVHVVVMDAAGNPVFESGEYAEDGKIMDNNLDADAATYEPHHAEITSPDEVQIYESIMVTTTDMPTTTLLRGSRYIKDNRIPPLGYDKNAVPEEIQVWGAAVDDADFTAGTDTVQYRIPLDGAEGPFTVLVELLYQSISYRWAMDMHTFTDSDAPEIAGFLDLYGQTPNIPELIATAEITVGG